MKDVFGLRKTRCRGLRKNHDQLCVAFVLADLCLLRWSGGRIPAA